MQTLLWSVLHSIDVEKMHKAGKFIMSEFFIQYNTYNFWWIFHCVQDIMRFNTNYISMLCFAFNSDVVNCIEVPFS